MATTMIMFCDEALDAVEAIAAGELTPDGRVAGAPRDVSRTARRRSRRARARADAAARAPRRARRRSSPRARWRAIRRARWRSDQFLDVGFNLAIGLVVVRDRGGVWMLLHRSGLTSVSNDAVDLFRSEFVALARRVAPSLPLYAGAAALLASALGIWWWAERGATF